MASSLLPLNLVRFQDPGGLEGFEQQTGAENGEGGDDHGDASSDGRKLPMPDWVDDTGGERKCDDVVQEGPNKVHVDAFDGGVGEIEKGDDVGKRVADEDGISGLDSDLSASSKSDTDVCLSESRAVVDAITDEGDDLAFLILKLLDNSRLVSRKLLGKDIALDIGDTDCAGDAVSGVFVVASDHDNADVAFAELLNQDGALGLGFVGKSNADADFAVSGEKNHGATFFVRLIDELLSFVIDCKVLVLH